MEQTVFDALGGADVVLALTRAHHARCLADEELNHPFSHADNRPDHVERLAAYWGEVWGGPARFSELSNQSEVLRLHACGERLDPWAGRFVDCFVGALDDVGVTDAALRAALTDYVRSAATAFVAIMPGTPEDVPDGLEIPRLTS